MPAMSGFAGEFLFQPGRADLDVARSMADRLAHRGPDQSGEFLSADGRCAIATRRLAVIDPTGSGQPMTTDDGLATIALDGGIYNFRELRLQMQAIDIPFTTAGDTEVLLQLYKLYDHWALDRLTGKFAFAFYDAGQTRLVLARDPLGQKPLWYSFGIDRVIFASEAKALLAHPDVSADIRRISVPFYLTNGYINSPDSAYSDSVKLLPGHMLEISDRPARPEPYWEPSWFSLPSAKPQRIELIRSHLTRSARQRLVGNVPVGALLSGGVSSAIVTALMAEQAGRAGGVKTFTIALGDRANEAFANARRVAEYVGTDHTELIVQPDPVGMLDRILDLHDEPFADPNALPTYLICRAARQHMTVALAGDGGNVAFGRCDRYRLLHQADNTRPFQYMFIRLGALLARPWAKRSSQSKLARFIRFAEILPLPPAQQYFKTRTLFDPEDLAFLLADDFAESLDLGAPADWFGELFEAPDVDDEITRAQYHDLATYLPDDVLTNTDLASMANGLELRAPMLDARVMQFGLSLPVDDKAPGGHILRETFADILPAETLTRPTHSFQVPLAAWLRGELADQMRETLLDPAVAAAKIFRPEALEGLINDHLDQTDDHADRLWALMVFCRWLLRRNS